MVDSRLSLNQKLALLPSIVPDCILDFLADFNNSEALQDETSVNTIDAEYLEHNKEAITSTLLRLREHGVLKDIEINTMPRKWQGAFACNLRFVESTVGMAVVVKQGTASTGRIVFLYVNDERYVEEELINEVATHLNQKV